ncbi:MAG: S8 family serine peptidase [Armatimonadota bacterium]
MGSFRTLVAVALTIHSAWPIALGAGFPLAFAGARPLEAATLHLKTGDFDPTKGNAHAQSIPLDNVWLVQFGRSLTGADAAAVQNAGASILGYIPDNAYLVKIDGRLSAGLSALAGVIWTGPYASEFRVSPDIPDSDSQVLVTVLLLPDQSAKKMAESLKAQNARVVSAVGSELVIQCSGKTARSLANALGVRWVEPRIQPKLANDVARGLMNVPAVWSDQNLYGTGQIVAVCDTGLDVGATSSNLSLDFQGRVVAAFDLGRLGLTNDPYGHGTHVAGSVLGSGVKSGSNPATHSYSGSLAGVAPEAKLVFQSVIDSYGNLGGLPFDIRNLFSQAYTAGARVHTNSWGSATSGVYEISSNQLDDFAWNNRDMVILFAAGNEAKDANSDGVIDLKSMDSPSVAKNCIAIGASESLRSSGGYQYAWSTGSWVADYPADPVKSDLISNNPAGMAAFSSRGPASDGRIKPDLVAPGTNIVSVRSHDPSASSGWGLYNSDYAYLGGTSMSTPLAAGVAVLVRQHYVDDKQINPSSALVKATLLATARDLSPGQYGTGSALEIPVRPNNVEGWGYVDARAATTPDAPGSVQFVDEGTGVGTGDIRSYTYTVVDASIPLRFLMCWTDYPGDPAASKALVNDLDLRVQSPAGAVYNGNGQLDRTNNVESVDIPTPEVGTYTVTISAYSVPRGPQPFALVVYGGLPRSSVSGQIVSTRGTPILGVAVSVSGPAGVFQATSAADGQYQISIPAGAYTVTPLKSGWSFTPPSHGITVALQSVSDVNFVAEAACASVSGFAYTGQKISTNGLWESIHSYTNHYTAAVTVNGPNNAARIRLHFSRFETEADYDFVTIQKATGETAASYSGSLGSFWTPWIDGKSAKVGIISDESITFYGFQIDKYEVTIPGSGLAGVVVKDSVSGRRAVTGADGGYLFTGVEPISSSLSATSAGLILKPAALAVFPSPGEALAVPGFVAVVEPPVVHLDIRHSFLGDLKVIVGVGNPASPQWSRAVSNRQGGSQSILQLDVPVEEGAQSWPPSAANPWYVQICDEAQYDVGTLNSFSVSKGSYTYWATDTPASINDLQCTTSLIPGKTPVSIGAAKQLVNGQECFLEGKIVTARFSDRFYVQEPDLSSAIAVLSFANVNPGDIVSVNGSLESFGCERTVSGDQVFVNSPGGADVRPVWLVCKNLGGIPPSLSSPGFNDSMDLNNLGMLVRVVGKATKTDPSYFYINDGTARRDPSGFSGVRVILPTNAIPPAVNSFVTVLGISNCKNAGFGDARVLYPRSPQDITVP